MHRFIHPYYFSRRKRIFDIAVATLLLFLTFPLFVFFMILVAITSRGPIIFSQRRIGKNSVPFIIYKFRTMHDGADNRKSIYRHLNQAPGPMFKIFNDPRFTGIGKWLSRTGFDELPQLFNVIKGDMSIIGPRPLPIKEAKRLPKNWGLRHQVRPGILSEWTLSPFRHQSLSIWEKLDRQGLTTSGIVYDTSILLQTTGLVLRAVLQ